jgi:hypothetical protein
MIDGLKKNYKIFKQVHKRKLAGEEVKGFGVLKNEELQFLFFFIYWLFIMNQ